MLPQIPAALLIVPWYIHMHLPANETCRQGWAAAQRLRDAHFGRERREMGPLEDRAAGKNQLAGCSPLCKRPMSVRRNTRLKRSWHDADTCSSSVELTFNTVTAEPAPMVAVRFAP